jgi:pyruvate kinase
MARIIESAEAGRAAATHARGIWLGKQSGSFSRALSEAAAFAAEEMSAHTIVVFTESGLMARRLSTLRPSQRIIALTLTKDVQNELSLIWGVESALHAPSERTEDLIRIGERTLLEAGVVQQNEVLVLMAGRLSGLGLSSSIKLHRIGGDVRQR